MESLEHGALIARYGAVVLAGVALAAMAVYGFMLVDDRGSAPPIIIEDPLIDAAIVVSVEGAVATPGVYQLNGDARVRDALDAAGGPNPDADLAHINPARRLRDEERLFIPVIGSNVAVPPSESSDGPDSTASADPVNLNRATADELDGLPRIGEVLAARIVAYREENGPFLTIEQLAAVEGISLDMVEELRGRITV